MENRINISAKRLTKFWSLVNKDGPVQPHVSDLGPCWVWVGGKYRMGYGRFRVHGREQYAHRISWQLLHGLIAPLPDDPKPCVMHLCDNTSCVNPSHLRVGSHKENTQDMFQKRRWRLPAYHRGSAHHNTTLTEAQVAEILSSPEPKSHLAERFRVGETTIARIKNREVWTHVDVASVPTDRSLRRTVRGRKQARISEEMAQEILRSGDPPKDAARRFGVSRSAVYNIRKRGRAA